MANIEEVLKLAQWETKKKLWVAEHFRVLPTDERFKQLTEEQMDILYFNFLTSNEDALMKEAYKKLYQTKILQETLPIDALKKSGYTDEQIVQMQDALSRVAV